MAKATVLMLYNEPVLPRDHIDAESEHSVVDNAQALAKSLTNADYAVEMFPLGSDPTSLWNELQNRKPDVVFNLFEGNVHNPETESYVTGLLEWSGIPYTGSPSATLTAARAKHTAKYILKGAGLPTADFFVVDHLPVVESPIEFPVIVKPAKQDASVGMEQSSVCTNQDELNQRVEFILATYGSPVIVEDYIPGREFNVVLVELPDLQALPPSEIIFREEKPGAWAILTYDGKWNPGTPEYDTDPPHFPADLPKATVRKLIRYAEKVYRVMGCRDYARVDFRMNPQGKLYVLEVNPNPEISGEASFAGCLGSAQMLHEEFVVRLVEQALKRRNLPTPTFDPIKTRTARQSASPAAK